MSEESTPLRCYSAKESCHTFPPAEGTHHSCHGGHTRQTPTAIEPCIDLCDEGDRYRLDVELPGFRREEIRIDIGPEHMAISAERISRTGDEDCRFLRCERYHGAVCRRFDLVGVKPEGITAVYENGVLHIGLPKKDGYDIPTRRLTVGLPET